jgi:LmbE family N-acetylglucosaminyl deacetylase
MNVLVIGAHPDDEVIGVGGTIARHVRAGDAVYVHLLTDGHSSRCADRSRAAQLAAEVLARRTSAERAAALLGLAGLEFASFADQRLDGANLIDVVKEIERFAASVSPDVVYMHHRGDVNADHRVAFEASLTAFRSVGAGYPTQLMCFETISSTEWSGPFPEVVFAPNVFVDISATLELKLEAMRAYAQELRTWPHPRSLEGLRVSARRWGSVVSLDAAEAFVLVRHVYTQPSVRETPARAACPGDPGRGGGDSAGNGGTTPGSVG